MHSKTLPITIKQALNSAMIELKRSRIPEAFLDSQILLSFVFNQDRSWLIAHDEKELNKKQISLYKKLIQKRSKWWPVAYLTKEKAFYNKSFLVTPKVLIPRPESELIVETVLDKINNSSKTFSLIDIGTGSGCLIISILANNKNQNINQAIAIDISSQALVIAKTNAKNNNLTKKIKFIKNNLLQDIYLEDDSKTDELIILANLPYLKPSGMKEPSIKHEPSKALLGGADGLSLYKKLENQLNLIKEDYLKPITLICEINPGQKNGLKKIWPKTKFLKDLAKKTRLGIVKL
ncbi:MAG: peptide chain release factor N(5)-glutamine methyltransferase [Candidatus Falkowbacteria bacterium]|nr:peptide chain release factor N(5)-glutamine methyltransferase [Candidatus Falkowbacteria bacterium]